MRKYAKIVNILAGWKYLSKMVRRFFAPKHLEVRLDASRGLRTCLRHLIAQAEDRQKGAQGTLYAGALLQHLVGAKLDCALGPGQFQHNSFSTADAPGARKGDFLISDVVIHVTTSPGEAIIDRCADNLNDGYRPILVTLQKRLAAAEVLAENKGVADRIDVFEIEQFLASNVYKHGRFRTVGCHDVLTDLVQRYNEVIDEVETDPSLQIDLRR